MTKDALRDEAELARQRAAIKPVSADFGPSLCNVSCGCGYTADFERFTQTPIGGDLPPGHFQCPSCARAWRIVKGKITITTWGAIISDSNRIEAIQPQL
jgi:hypothetical protein